MKATHEEGISTQENQLMGISSSSIVGICSSNTPVLYQSISILRLPLSILPNLVRITFEGRDKLDGETGEQQRDKEEIQEALLKKWKYDKKWYDMKNDMITLFQIVFCFDL